ncbi:hypothetical protein ACFL6U_07995 [Planctomycetota bacterium]
MTIQFHCPKCQALIAFDDRHAGKRAHCATCSEAFLIPTATGESVGKLSVEPTVEDVPLPGFYRAVFIDAWTFLLQRDSLPGLVFVAAAVSFKFFTAHLDYSADVGPSFRLQAPVGLIISLWAWGCLFWYYLEILANTTLDINQLPEIDLEGFCEWAWQIVRSLCLFASLLVVSQLPSVVWLLASRRWALDLPLLDMLFSYVGLSILPMLLITTGVGKAVDSLLQPQHFIRPMIRALAPYTLCTTLLLLTCQGQLWSRNYSEIRAVGNGMVAIHLGLQLGIQVLAVLTMRTMGLFYRHYQCYFFHAE